MKTQYTPAQLRRRTILWESVKNISLIAFGGLWAMFLTTDDGLGMVAWALLALAALLLAVLAADRHEAWQKRKVAGW
jgi:hypothetical protein